MNYQVLARRYRPRRFEEVVGQESIAATLRGGIQQDRVAHAYLFAGPRGVGKTSMARIFAKALNCPRAADRSRDRELWGEPCNECSTCDAIHVGQDIDVVELDGASHRGIEDVRSIIEGVNRPATKSPFKIYIIDEVHMLTREAFNALLKTLEEPPRHVKFIFATTEPHRIPETVLSRCQRFEFHPIGEEAIVRRLAQILEAEGGTAEEGLLENVARCGKGGLRDAQTLLDQLMTFAQDALTHADLEKVTGRVAEGAMEQLADAVTSGESARALELMQRCFAEGADPSMVLEQLIEILRRRLRVLVERREAEDPGGGARAAGGGGSSVDKLIGCLQILLETASRLKFSAFVEATVEVAILKLSRLEEPRALEEAIRVLREIERKGGAPVAQAHAKAPGAGSPLVARASPRATPEASPPVARQSAPQSAAAEAPEGAPQEAPAVPAGPVAPSPAPQSAPGASQQFSTFDFQRLRSLWDQIRVELETKYPSISPYLKDLLPAPVSGVEDQFVLAFPSKFHSRQMRSEHNQQKLLEVVRDVTGAGWRCRIEDGAPARPAPAEAAPAREPPPPASVPNGEAPPSPGGEAGGQRPSAGDDPLVQKTLDLFRGHIV